ncbi:MAG: hypothetical protein PHF70_08990, partial [Opitutales bacterium]|nr:hypothetical protein [Opitutales bacterium]
MPSLPHALFRRVWLQPSSSAPCASTPQTHADERGRPSLPATDIPARVLLAAAKYGKQINHENKRIHSATQITKTTKKTGILSPLCAL